MRILDFVDGFESESSPSQGAISANSDAVFADDAAYVTAKGSAAAAGDSYFNSTTGLQKHYNGSAWVNSDSNTAMGMAGSASAFLVSSVLAGGTNVTALPAALGEYRTYVKSSSDTAGTDDAPTAAPTEADGMRVYGNKNYAAAGTSGETGQWEIYVGVNKCVKFQFYGSTGKSTLAQYDYHVNSPTNITGVLTGYDPTTGVAIVDGMTQLTTCTSRAAGSTYAAGGAATASAPSLYFDIIVSESSVVQISTQLAAGSNVVATPTAMGEYRTYIKSAGLLSGVDDAPTAAPTAADGMRIYGDRLQAQAGVAGQTGRWEIYVGVNKLLQFQYYAAAGKTGYADTDYFFLAGGENGLSRYYDKTAGIVIVDAMFAEASTTVKHAGTTSGAAGAGRSSLASVYFDIFVL